MVTRSRALAGSRRGRSSYPPAPEGDLQRFVARELHDRVAQALTAMLVNLEVFRGGQVGRRAVLEEIDGMQASLRDVLGSLRELLFDLRGESRPPSEPFTEAVAGLLDEFEAQSGIDARLTVGPGWPAEIEPAPAINLRRIIGEALTNVRRHSDARHVTVEMKAHGSTSLSITVSDDGRGFGVVGGVQPGLGIVGMREQALLLGASLQMRGRDTAGTTLSIIVPRRVCSRSPFHHHTDAARERTIADPPARSDSA